MLLQPSLSFGKKHFSGQFCKGVQIFLQIHETFQKLTRTGCKSAGDRSISDMAGLKNCCKKSTKNEEVILILKKIDFLENFAET